MEGVNVQLIVTGKQTDPDGNTQESTSFYHAVCSVCGKGFLFSYFADGREVRLFISRDSAWMQRGPGRSARMVFDPSLPCTQCDYETDYGTIPMVIRTGTISVLAGGPHTGDKVYRNLKARIRYTLVMGSDYELTCSVTIKTRQVE